MKISQFLSFLYEIYEVYMKIRGDQGMFNIEKPFSNALDQEHRSSTIVNLPWTTKVNLNREPVIIRDGDVVYKLSSREVNERVRKNGVESWDAFPYEESEGLETNFAADLCSAARFHDDLGRFPRRQAQTHI